MNPETLLVAALAIGCGALAKGATGMGLPLVALPMLATVLGLPHAIAVLFFPIFLSNLWQVWAYRDHRRGQTFLPVFLLCGLVGIAAGTVFLASVPAQGLKLTLGLLLVAYLALRVARPRFVLPARARWPSTVGAGFAAGLAQGATGIASPVLVTFLHSLRLGRDAHVFAISTMFLALAAVQLPALAIAGLITPPMLLESALAMIPVFAMMPVGAWLARRFGEPFFDRAVVALLVLMAGRLLLEGSGVV